MKVKALKNFAHSKSEQGFRSYGEVFNCDKEEVEKLNSLHDEPLVEIVEEIPDDKTSTDETDAADKKSKKPRNSKKTKSSDGDSDAVSDGEDE
ncbi:hypothetical protein [Streptococcus caballi]|uniref:hypothetical protein n=1 Tax=Streptococcus caballi TaxID=439220 RepID=UPI0003792764|nr:hypothetical protein [Streptococcus caballi]